ncbi:MULTISPECIES: PLP-dependent aminotransferase family protein [Micromonospora]|uniref:PLP-dependent aminotransferase family protein n=1 Tax=Micromonospora solifontis TaxID=2487138 RepID=A0ABX9WG81_9ACTN|nr:MULTISPECIES: PLP-dependent aminotransferase family protein [Micromonospora]NES12227.1 PLP-dependent aminotransferase family protein [Micromonospora sp. PPF5-17B]NES36971.1 PLP-dependent aminotransferase family protein [Micromonospora solifontis]NES54290.1 PLP-dependent aminotransferase family protein [Micromonospora sp. PPF5-6]RNL98893.1 PLP-dependent aminotransferase family protein [Micromonospora solifontis]
MTSQVRGVQLARLLGQWHALPGRRRSPDYAALAGAVRGLLADGRLPLGVRLPAERELAEALRISRTTVTAAYRELRETGHLASRRGAGSWTMLPGTHRVASTGLWTPLDDRDMIDLGVAALAAPPQLVPAARAATEDLPRYLGGAGYHPTGIIELREAVARSYTERGLPTSPEQIMVTSGTQHALDLVLRLALSPGGGVLVESPTYPNALAALAARRARITTHGLAADGVGWDADLLLGSIRQGRPKLAYLIPEFQNPTGHLMAAELRERLVGAAHAAGTDLVIDESFVDLPLDGTELPPPVATFDRHSRVISIGGMSKPYWGGLRIGWVRASAPQVQRLAAARVGVDMASPVLDQLVAVHLLADAPAIVAARRTQLAAQRDALVGALAERLPDWRVTAPRGGVTLWAELDGPVSSALARAAEEVGVRLAPGPRFGLDGTLERFLRLPFTLPAADLVEAVGRLAAVRYDLDRAGRPQWREPSVIA